VNDPDVTVIEIVARSSWPAGTVVAMVFVPPGTPSWAAELALIFIVLGLLTASCIEASVAGS
jgi:hypothetical protein